MVGPESSPLPQLIDELSTGLRALRVLQRRYDDVGWRIEEPSWAKARHVLLHLVSITAELAKLIENVEHAEERGEVPSSGTFVGALYEHRRMVADMLFHAAQFANMADLDLAEELQNLYATNASRFAPDSEFASLARAESSPGSRRPTTTP
jgi:NTP pyrophosphatase (non-canonical NTP hydrolase)